MVSTDAEVVCLTFDLARGELNGPDDGRLGLVVAIHGRVAGRRESCAAFLRGVAQTRWSSWGTAWVVSTERTDRGGSGTVAEGMFVLVIVGSDRRGLVVLSFVQGKGRRVEVDVEGEARG